MFEPIVLYLHQDFFNDGNISGQLTVILVDNLDILLYNISILTIKGAANDPDYRQRL